MENWVMLHQIAHSLVHTQFAEQWQWRTLFKEYPGVSGVEFDLSVFDLFCKDITYGTAELQTDEDQIGMCILSWPRRVAPATISMTMRDTPERSVYRWFKSWIDWVAVNPGSSVADGTVQWPSAYVGVMTIESYIPHSDSWQALEKDIEVIPQKLGEITPSRGEGGFLEFPITMIQFSSNSKLKFSS